MSPINLLLLIAIGILVAGSTLAANLIAVSMVNRINQKLPSSDQMSYISWDSSVRRKFNSLYPGDNLVRYYDLCFVLMVIGFLLVLRFCVFGYYSSLIILYSLLLLSLSR